MLSQVLSRGERQVARSARGRASARAHVVSILPRQIGHLALHAKQIYTILFRAAAKMLPDHRVLSTGRLLLAALRRSIDAIGSLL
jgi:hypothetical protein